MAVINPKLCLLLLLTFSLILVPSLSYKRFEPEQEEESPEGELFDCFVRCDKRQGNDDEHDLTKCEQKCVDIYKERERQEREEEERGGGGGGAGNRDQPLEQRYKECRSRCGAQRQGQQRQYCEKRCQWELERHGGGKEREREREPERQTRNPYFFEKQRFDTKFRSDEGHIKVLQRFSKKSELLRGIDNYRLSILEANPNTFVLPHHSDAESIFFVVGGNGTISYVWENERRSYNLKEGDVTRVPAGAVVYLINRDDNEKLYILKLLQPVNTPGKFKDFFGVGGENPESYYTAFSNEILEAAFNAPSDDLEKLFRQERKEGVIIRASKEQIRALSEKSGSSSSKGSKGERWSPINLKKKSPSFSNKFGQYFEASPNDHDQLKDLDVAVGFMNIKKGGMIAPYYNSRSTKIAFVVEGSGYFEMACPHIAEQMNRDRSREGREGVQYEKVRARLSVGDAFVVPAGHPTVMVASGDSDLMLASFGINGAFNQKHFLAGKENIWNEVETEAKALTFGRPAAEVEKILKKQDESYFVAGPEQQQQQQQGKSRRVASILDFGGF